MSMNFGREQALLRQRLQAKGSEERVTEQQAQFGDVLKFLGASDDEVAAAANDLAETYPEMGRAQMTAFVRTLWQSKTHELRAVGVHILSLRAGLLEPPDLPFLEGLLKDEGVEAVAEKLANEVLGPLVGKNKKLWRNLKKLASDKSERLRRAAVRATRAPVSADPMLFERFEEIVTPLLSDEDATLQSAIDGVLHALAVDASEQVKAFADQHERKVKGGKMKATKKSPKK